MMLKYIVQRVIKSNNFKDCWKQNQETLQIN